MQTKSNKWSSSSIPSTGFRIPDSSQSDSKEYGKIVVQHFKKRVVTILIPVPNFTIALPSVCREPLWDHFEDHTELMFFIHSHEYDEHVPFIAQSIGILV